MARVLLAFEPPDGGVPEQVMQLALGLGDHGHEVELAGPREAIVYPRMEAAGLPVFRFEAAVARSEGAAGAPVTDQSRSRAGAEGHDVVGELRRGWRGGRHLGDGDPPGRHRRGPE